MPKRNDRKHHEHRPIEIIPGFHRNAEGSVLYRAGGTVVLCTASVDDSNPKRKDEGAGGWHTAEYELHPRANPQRRESREGRGRAPRGRTMEIQRLVGRALRSAMDLRRLGPRSITVDCDVLEADGGTRTAAITAGYIATAMAIHSIGLIGVLRDQVAAISVGFIDDEVRVDLDYAEDSRARVDMNVVASRQGHLVEVQSTSEGRPISRDQFDAMLASALTTIEELCATQIAALDKAGVDLDILMKRVE